MSEEDMIREAALCDQAALKTLTEYCLGFGLSGVIPALEALAGSEVVARLAAARGLPQDQMVLALILQIRAQRVAVIDREAEALEYQDEADTLIASISPRGEWFCSQVYVAWMSRIAELGCDTAASHLDKFMARLSPSCAAKVRDAAPRVRYIVDALTSPLPVTTVHDVVPAKFDLTPPTRRERLTFWLADVGFSLRVLRTDLADLWRAIRGN